MKMRICWGGLAACFLLFSVACGGGGNGVTVRCVTDRDCPDYQVCVAGDCVLPGDEGPRVCSVKQDCYPGEDCIAGLCKPSQEEPLVDGGEDGGWDAGGDKGGDTGGDEVVQPDGGEDAGEDAGGGDEGLGNFSDLSFILAIGGNGTVAAQCISDLRPAANVGPWLPDTNALPIHTLSGRVTSGGGSVSGATVRILGEPLACHDGPVTTDGTGNYSLRLPTGGPVDLRAEAPDGRVAQVRLNYVSANTSQDIVFPATELLRCSLRDQGGGWSVSAYYRESNPPRLAHTGALSDASGVVDIPLEAGPRYDLFVRPPAASTMPYQLLIEEVCHPDEGCINDQFFEGELKNIRVKDGVTLSGTVAQQGASGVAGASLSVVNVADGRLSYATQATTGGAFQLGARPGILAFEILPTGAAFAQGCMRYWDPGLQLYQDLMQNFSIYTGQAVAFSGKLLDSNGTPLANMPVSLILDETPAGVGSFGLCDQNHATTAADGSYQVTCNLIPR